jgi:hypothetical protein
MVNSTAVHIKENGHIWANNQSQSSISMPKTMLNNEKCPKRESHQNDDISKQMGYRVNSPFLYIAQLDYILGHFGMVHG